MKKIKLDDFSLEEFDENNKEHLLMIQKLDFDFLINKYLIMEDDSYKDIIDYYRLFNNDDIYNKAYLIRLLSSNELIGTLELDGPKDNLYINYSILKEYRNKGLGTRIMRELTIKLLKEIQSICLLIKEDNVASKNLALSVGFKRIEKQSSKYEETSYDKYQINKDDVCYKKIKTM